MGQFKARPARIRVRLWNASAPGAIPLALGPLKVLVDYDLAKVRNVRLEQPGPNDPDTVQVRFDYDGGANSLGNAMRRSDGQRLVDAITTAARVVPRAVEARQPESRLPDSTTPAPTPAVSLPLTSGSAVALVAANFVPLAGVLFFGWDLGNIMLLYWVESGVIAFYTVMKIAMVGKLAAIVAVPFFIGHGVSFVTHFVGRREYAGATVSTLMHAPYNRVIVMHLTLILGGWIILLIGMPTGALAMLLLLKTAVDLRAHRYEHAVAASRGRVVQG